MGPKERRSTVLSALEEAAMVSLRVQARLPLDDVYIAQKYVIPHLSRSSLHRCLQRHGVSRLPKADREKPKRFKSYEIGYFHIDIAELRYEGGKAFLFVAVDRTSKIVVARIDREATKLVEAGFLKTNRAWVLRSHLRCVMRSERYRAPSDQALSSMDEWAGERMDRTIKDATVKSFHHASLIGLRRRVRDWLLAYNYAKQLKALRFKTLRSHQTAQREKAGNIRSPAKP